MGVLRALSAVALLAIFAGFFWVSVSLAQDTASAPDYADWEAVATRAETALAGNSAPTARLTALREELAEWRASLLEAEAQNSDRVATLRDQVDALGPPPDGAAGESEPTGIAERRAELAIQLAEAEAPQVRALEAYNRANGLISEIDDVVRTRQTEALLEAVPTPANPANWPGAFQAMSRVGAELRREAVDTIGSEFKRQEIRRRLPVTLALLAGAFLLLARGRSWMTHLTDLVQGRGRWQGRLVIGFLISITKVLVPLGGFLLFLAAVASLNPAGTIGLTLLQGLVWVIVIVYGTLWLVNRLFPSEPELPTLFDLEMSQRRAMRRSGILIGCVMGAWSVVNGIAGIELVDPPAVAVFNLPVILALGYGFWRLSRQLIRSMKSISGDESPGFGNWFILSLGRALGVAAVVAPIAALAGYNALANAIAVPTGYTLGLVGLFVVLQWPIRDVYAAITRTKLEDASDALVPVLVNAVLLIGALPVLALVWGMRPERLGEIWARVAEGVPLGGTRLTPGVVLTVILVFAVGYMVTRLVQGALKSTVLPRTRLDAGARNAVTSFVGYVGIGLAALFAVTSGGIDLTALGYIFGALSVGIGFGLQNVVQNFVAGIILLIERPIGEGDWIEVGGHMGTVKSISVRSTTIETFDRQAVIVPNADFISGTVTNWTRDSDVGRAKIEVGVAYGTDTRRVEAILAEIAREHPVVALYPEPGVDFVGFGASSLDFRIRVILRDVNRLLEVTTEIRHRIAERFAEEEIEIPFAQQDVWLRNPETLAHDARAERAVPAPPPPRSRPDGPEGSGEDAD